MYQINFDSPVHVHFIGIGGISMSGLAEILLGEDFIISGSDAKSSPLTQALEKKGARIYYGQRACRIAGELSGCFAGRGKYSTGCAFAAQRRKRSEICCNH